MKKELNLLLIFVLIFFDTFAQTPVSGGIYSNTTWNISESPYIVIDDVVVFNGVTLTIEPGVVIQFNDEKKLTIRGHLNAVGNESDTIMFTSSSENPTIGIWDGVEVELFNGGSALFDYCEFQYANYAVDIGWFGSGPGPVSISHSKFIYNERGTYGYANFTLYISDCLFENNNHAISSAYTYVENSKLVNNVYGSYLIGEISFHNCILCGHDIAMEVGGGPIENCLIFNNNIGIRSYGTLSNVDSNTIVYNDIGLEISFELGVFNTICHNFSYNVKNLNSFNVDISNNCWCSIDSAEIANTIYDGYDDASLGIMSFVPFLNCDSTAIPSSIFANCNIAVSSDTICLGEEVIFTASSENGGDNPLFEWFLNGELVGSNNSVFLYSAFEDGDEVFCILTSSENCLINNPATSNTITLTVNSLLEVNIIALPNDTVCTTEIVTLDAGIENATYYWSTGDTTQQLSVTNTSGPSGGLQSYWVIVSDTNNCQSTDSIDIYFDPCLNLQKNYNNIDLDVFPNPTTGEILIDIKGKITFAYISITDLSGNLIRKEIISSNNNYLYKIDLSSEKTGIYLISLKTIDGTVILIDKIIKL